MIGRWIWRWFEFPAFEDEAIRQVTVRFYTILLLSIGLNLGYMVVLLITGRGIRMSLVGSLVILLLQCAGLLLAGSHNLTLSGFSFNRELTNCFEYAGDKDRALLPVFHSALRFIKAWAATLPRPLYESVNAISRLAPWLQEPEEPQEMLEAAAEIYFFGSDPNGRSLWEMARERMPGRVKRIVVVGPFYDQKLTFIKRLGEEFSPKHLVVGLEPEA